MMPARIGPLFALPDVLPVLRSLATLPVESGIAHAPAHHLLMEITAPRRGRSSHGSAGVECGPAWQALPNLCSGSEEAAARKLLAGSFWWTMARRTQLSVLLASLVALLLLAQFFIIEFAGNYLVFFGYSGSVGTFELGDLIFVATRVGLLVTTVTSLS
jgi:hypothetical protein